MLIQPPDDEHTSHTVTKMAADLSAYADYIVNMTGVTSCINVSLTRFHGVIAFQSSQLWLIRIWVELFCVSYIKSTAVNDVCPLSDAMLRHVVVNISSITRILADFQRCQRSQTHSQSHHIQMNCDLNVRRLRTKSKFLLLWILPLIACEEISSYPDVQPCFHCMACVATLIEYYLICWLS